MTSAPDQLDAAFLAEVRRRRLERNWTQTELARRTDGLISASTLAGYESGHRRIRLGAAGILARALDMKLSTLVAHAENVLASSDGTRLDVTRLLQADDPLLEPVRRWLAVAHPEVAGPQATLALTDGALTALSDLMDVTPAACRATLAPYFDPVGRPLPATSTRSTTAWASSSL